jgi:phosphate transport system permease protein
MASVREYLRRGDAAIWFAGSGLGVSLLMIGGMIAIILVNGLGFFWPAPIAKLTLNDGDLAMGEIVVRELIPNPENPLSDAHRIQVKAGNRDVTGADFRWIDESAIAKREYPSDAVYVERREYGPFIGTVSKLVEGERTIATGSDETWKALVPLIEKAAQDRAAIRRLERDEIGAINYLLEKVRLRQHKLELEETLNPGQDASGEREALAREDNELQKRYAEVEEALAKRQADASRTTVTLLTATGDEKELPTVEIYRAYRANELSTIGRARIYAGRLWEFVADEPRESNTEGGIFPAIFGTVMMVIIMSLMAVPFGVLAALYLREYAKQGVMVRIVRIAVNNLAGVPSIVFGVFGLGFFVYFVGGTIDQLFYPERLPTPTFGTGGILWASMTLGLLTVPVVIVASEEALSAVPRSMREASLATGATKFQTILRVVLPAAAPGILTGLILAMARGAGEVAPLMITGVVKLAPDMPLDGLFPFLHLERKFMHLGFHIYDVGFQSPNVEAAKPMVYATSVLLLLIVVLLNLTAIVVRNRLRRKYQTSAF